MKKSLLYIFISWKLFVVLGIVFGAIIFPLQTSFLGGGVDLYLNNVYLWALANFDGVHYLSISQNGYFQFEQAFFPLFPLLIRILGALGWEPVRIGIILSNIFFVLSLYFLGKLLALDFERKEKIWILLFIVFFPTSYYFGAVYTESLFLLLSVLSFYFVRKGNWMAAGLCGMFASLTRFVGVFLLPALIFEYLSQKGLTLKFSGSANRLWFWKRLSVVYKKSRNKQADVLWLFLIPAGLIGYMLWLGYTYGDPLFFIHAQPAFGANRSGGNIVLLPQVIFRYLKIFFTADLTYQYGIAAVEFIVTVFFLILWLIGLTKIRFSYILYSFLSLLGPTLTGSLSSMPRYVLTIFPLFISLNFLLKKRLYKCVILFVFGALLVLFTALFTRGYWVS